MLCLLPLVHIFAVSLSGRAPATGGFVSFYSGRFYAGELRAGNGLAQLFALVSDIGYSRC